MVGPKWLAELGWGLLAAVACLTVMGCSLFWEGVVDPTEINELHIFRRQDSLSTDILSTAFRQQTFRQKHFVGRFLWTDTSSTDIFSKKIRGNPIDVQEQQPAFY